MLAQSVMIVVFVLDESISLGINLTATLILRATMEASLKVPQRRVLLETARVERVNPTSEKPKFGRGVSRNELKGRLDIERYR